MDDMKARIDTIADAVCAEYGVTRQALRGESMITQVVEPRQVAVHLCRKLTGGVFWEIGQYVAGYAEKSASVANQKIVKRATGDQALAERIAKIESAIAPAESVLAKLGKGE